MLFAIKTISNFVNVLHLHLLHHIYVKNENFVYIPTIFQGLTRIRYFSFLLRDIRAFSETKEKNDMFRLPTELEYVLCWPCNMDVYLTCHFLTHAFLPKAYYVYGQFYQILPMSYNVIRNSDLNWTCTYFASGRLWSQYCVPEPIWTLSGGILHLSVRSCYDLVRMARINKWFLLIRNFVVKPIALVLYEWNFTKPGKMPLFNACIPA